MLCPDISTSLQDGQTKLEGTVVLGGKFVCSNKWDVLEGQVVCRELGYPHLIHVKETEKNDSNSTGFTEFSCRGDEPSLQACVHLETNQTCGHKLAAVECSLSEKGTKWIHTLP